MCIRDRIRVVEVRAPGEQGHRLLACVDEVFVFLSRSRAGPDAEYAVLAVQEDLAALRHVVGDQRRQADAEVHHRAAGDVARDARRHLVAIELFHHAAFCRGAATLTTRLTKIPGVMIASGSSPPSSTVSRTCTTVHLAALAMIGAKLRAVLR